ncbi:MAG TPA: glycosyltransferase family 2 protein [Planctomycetota bacterium]|nr:glycosyltransferase family 2 protein [Planctomycetota bacterium]
MLNGILIGILSLVLLMWVLRHGMMTRTLRDDPHLAADPDAPIPDDRPLVSVIIPARNEARNIRRTLDALLVQHYPRFEVIVADDRSNDETPGIVGDVAARDKRVRLIKISELPEGWTGKNHALWRAQQDARGELLLFLDADVALDPGALAVLVADLLDHHVDMLSTLLRLDSHSFWEKSIRVVLGSILMVRHPLRQVNDPRSTVAFANGQLILIRSDVYREIGGHASVKSILLEDVALAHEVKRRGKRLRAAYGFDLASARMYDSLGEIFRGWRRIYYSGFGGSAARVLFGVVLLVVFTLFPYFCLVFSGATLVADGFSAGTLALLVLSIVEIAVMLALMVRMHRLSRCEVAYVAMHPAAGLIALGILLAAASRRFAPGGIVWKGTRYDTRRNRH